MSSAEFVEGDTGSVFQATCKNEDTDAVIDLTGATVTLRWLDSADSLVSKAMSIIGDPALGVAEYKFLATELIAPAMTFEVKVVDAGGFILHNLDEIVKSVRKVLS